MTSPHHDDVEGDQLDQPAINAYIDQVGAVIREHGWAIQGVFATKESDLRYDFAYTVGLMARGCTAELLIAGIPMQSAAGLLNEIAANMVNNQQMIPPAEWEAANGFKLKAVFFIPRRGNELHLGAARAFYQHENVPVAQYVWPDTNHNYPWDEGWDAGLVQPYGNP